MSRFERGLNFPAGLDRLPAESLSVFLKAEIERLDAGVLPFQEALTQSSYAVVDRFSARVIAVDAGQGRLRVHAGLFYAGIIAGCNCADDPTPVDEIAEYCEVLFDIDTASGAATVALIDD
jgi:hypothetical protein